MNWHVRLWQSCLVIARNSLNIGLKELDLPGAAKSRLGCISPTSHRPSSGPSLFCWTVFSICSYWFLNLEFPFPTSLSIDSYLVFRAKPKSISSGKLWASSQSELNVSLTPACSHCTLGACHFGKVLKGRGCSFHILVSPIPSRVSSIQ